MKKLKIDLIAGARPNFMKIAPIIESIQKAQNLGEEIYYRLIHTGQHYDKNMSDSFFEQLRIPKPDVNLGCGGGTQAEQTASIMIGYEKLLFKEKPNLCLVVGDVTSTMSCSIVAKKLHIPVAHVEAGIRSGDWSMPEEINRMVTDSISNYFFTTTRDAGNNLKKTGIKTFIIHARKAMLGKFTPKQNLNIPPLKYEYVYKLKEDFPKEEIIINGGITSVEEIKPHLKKTDGE